MKKLFVFLLMIFSPLFLRAQDDTDSFELNMRESEAIEDEKEPEPPVKFRLKNRTVELSLANVSIDVSNNFFAAADIFKDPFYIFSNINDIIQDPALIYQDSIVVDLDEFFKGFEFNFNAVIKPFSFNFNRNDKWGFGLDIGHINAMGNVAVSGNVMRLEKAENEQVGGGGAVFADVGIPIFFHFWKLKIKIRPAAYVPIIYTEPNVTYSNRNVSGGTYIETVYDMRIYSLVDLNDDIMQGLQDEVWNIPGNNLGYDFRLGMEYPFNSRLDVGLDIVNIPIPFAAAKLNHYSRLNGKVVINTGSIDLTDLADEAKEPKDVLDDVWDYENEFTSEYDSDGKEISRPFSMLLYANYRPFGSRIFSLIPSLGFSINRLYPQIFSLEGGLNIRFDFANIFIPVFGINYNDRKWKNSIDFALNLRIIEIDFGVSSQSQDFIKSFQGAGLGVNFGIKLGW